MLGTWKSMSLINIQIPHSGDFPNLLKAAARFYNSGRNTDDEAQAKPKCHEQAKFFGVEDDGDDANGQQGMSQGLGLPMGALPGMNSLIDTNVFLESPKP